MLLGFTIGARSNEATVHDALEVTEVAVNAFEDLECRQHHVSDERLTILNNPGASVPRSQDSDPVNKRKLKSLWTPQTMPILHV